MNRILTTALLVLSGLVSASAFAQTCPGGTTRVTGGTPADPNGPGNFVNFITGATICAARGTDRWQEFHASNGDLIDYKLGPESPTNKVDPTKKVGVWSASNGASATVTHTYGNTNYEWAVCRVGTGLTYTLVSLTGGAVSGATILAGQVPCL
jgi:hypothetical protein